EHLLVVEQDDGLSGALGEGVDLVVHRRGVPDGLDESVLVVRVLLEPRGDVQDLRLLGVRAQTAAAPAVDDRRRLAGTDRGADLLLVSVVLEERDLDLTGITLVEGVHGIAVDRLVGLSGQGPVGRAVAASAAAGTAGSGGAAGAEGEGGEPGAGAEQGTAGELLDGHDLLLVSTMTGCDGLAGAGCSGVRGLTYERKVLRSSAAIDRDECRICCARAARWRPGRLSLSRRSSAPRSAEGLTVGSRLP